MIQFTVSVEFQGMSDLEETIRAVPGVRAAYPLTKGRWASCLNTIHRVVFDDRSQEFEVIRILKSTPDVRSVRCL